MTSTLRNYVVVWILAIILLGLGGQIAAVLLMLALIAWSFRSPLAVIQALSLGWFVTSFNFGQRGIGEEIAGGPAIIVLLKLGLSLAASFHIFARMTVQPEAAKSPFVIWISAFCATAAIASSIVSYAVDVSLFKIASFWVGALTAVAAHHYAMRDQRGRLLDWYHALFATIVVACIPLLFLPLGYVVNGQGFQGWLNQPQGFGVFAAIAAAYFVAHALKGWNEAPVETALAIVAVLMVLLSQSRNAVQAVVFAGAFSALLQLRREPRRGIAVVFGALVALSVVLLLPQTQTAMRDFLSKYTGQPGTNVSASLQESRGRLVEASLANFTTSPVIGIGFGVASNPHTFKIGRDPYFGLPVTAPIEKGVLWVSILEEVGLAGVIMMLGLLGSLFLRVARARELGPFMVSTCALLTNNGEATLFSFNGLGALIWLVLAFEYFRAAEPQ